MQFGNWLEFATGDFVSIVAKNKGVMEMQESSGVPGAASQ